MIIFSKHKHDRTNLDLIISQLAYCSIRSHFVIGKSDQNGKSYGQNHVGNWFDCQSLRCRSDKNVLREYGADVEALWTKYQ